MNGSLNALCNLEGRVDGTPKGGEGGSQETLLEFLSGQS